MADEYFRWEQEQFRRTLIAYLQRTSRTLPDVLNTKGFFIARRAVLETPRTSPGSIKSELGSLVTKGSRLQLTSARSKWLTFGGEKYMGLSLAEAIIRARFARDGKPQPTIIEMRKLVEKLLAVRNRSRGYLAAGWIPVIKQLEAVIDPKYRRGAPANDSQIKQVGLAKGKADPARAGFLLKTTIENRVGITGVRASKQNQALIRLGTPALARAFLFEAASMMKYLEERMGPDAEVFNASQRN